MTEGRGPARFSEEPPCRGQFMVQDRVKGGQATLGSPTPSGCPASHQTHWAGHGAWAYGRSQGGSLATPPRGQGATSPQSPAHHRAQGPCAGPHPVAAPAATPGPLLRLPQSARLEPAPLRSGHWPGGWGTWADVESRHGPRPRTAPVSGAATSHQPQCVPGRGRARPQAEGTLEGRPGPGAGLPAGGTPSSPRAASLPH